MAALRQFKAAWFVLLLGGTASALQTGSKALVPGGPEEAAGYIREAQLKVSNNELSKAAAGLHTSADASGVYDGAYAQEAGVKGKNPLVTVGKQLIVPAIALLFGGVLLSVKGCEVVSQLLMFFGAQTFMNIYMKAVLSNSVVSETLHMKGFQGPLILTGLQQLISFAILVVGIAVSRLCGRPYRPKVVSSAWEVLSIGVLAVSFAANIALNNFSLSLLDMSVNVMIRSTSPLSTLALQAVFARLLQNANLDLSAPQVLLMLGGIGCAILVVLSKGSSLAAGDHSGFTLGIILCVASLLASSMELIVVALLCKGSKMNPIDTVLYMALPVVAILVLPAVFIQHPVSYPGHGKMTDWSVFAEVARLNTVTIILVVLSGFFALCYNLLLYTVVKDLSPFTAAFAANFNKVVAIGLALIFGLEKLPKTPWNVVMTAAVLGNMACFTGYSIVGRGAPPKHK